MKNHVAMVAGILIAGMINAQTNFSGTWSEPELQMIYGKQYSNAVPKSIKVTQTKDSIKLERTSVGNDGDVTVTETFALNGKEISRVGKTSKRTIKTSASWSNNGTVLILSSFYSYPEKPDEAEFKNKEVWEINDSKLVITKDSDATVTDDWAIKATYSKQ